MGGEEVVHHDLDPLAELPEAEAEDPGVLLVLLPFLIFFEKNESFSKIVCEYF